MTYCKYCEHATKRCGHQVWCDERGEWHEQFDGCPLGMVLLVLVRESVSKSKPLPVYAH